MRLLIATSNAGKLLEYRRLFNDLELDLLSPTAIELRDADVEETGTNFEENAALKASFYADKSQLWSLADDSGLMVDALEGAPGVHSARYGGAALDDAGRRHKLLQALKDCTSVQRKAKFVCVIAIADPNADSILLARGECPGKITAQEQYVGHGFGYDSIFQPEGYKLTFGQMTAEQKNKLSHRAIAAEKALPALRQIMARAL